MHQTGRVLLRFVSRIKEKVKILWLKRWQLFLYSTQKSGVSLTYLHIKRWYTSTHSEGCTRFLNASKWFVEVGKMKKMSQKKYYQLIHCFFYVWQPFKLLTEAKQQFPASDDCFPTACLLWTTTINFSDQLIWIRETYLVL